MTKALKQKLFDKAVLGLAKQKFKQSRTNDGYCMFRGPHGLKCAVGHLIQNGQYTKRMDDTGEVDEAVMEACGVKPSNVMGAFLRELQACHDDEENPAEMRQALIEFARYRRLSIPKVLTK